MYFGRKEEGKIKIYECEILNETNTYYQIKLKNKEEGRLILKEQLDKKQIDGIASNNKELIENMLKE